MRVLPFERDEDGAFKPPETWDPLAAAMTSTHDLPPTAGWWRGRDIDWRERLARRAIAPPNARAAPRTGARSGKAPPPPASPKDRSRRRCARPRGGRGFGLVGETPCELALVPIEDLLGLDEQPNLPGVVDVHPNWRRRLPWPSEALLSKPAVAATAGRLERPETPMIPSATYRVQFHAGFTFADAAALAPYWAKLGVSHLYASPIATARAGSTHGYDVVDPTRSIRRSAARTVSGRWSRRLRAEGLGVVLDIVPNHVAVGGDDNAWWLDVLENGRASAFARMFDIDWAPTDPISPARCWPRSWARPMARRWPPAISAWTSSGCRSWLTASIASRCGARLCRGPRAAPEAYDPATPDGRARPAARASGAPALSPGLVAHGRRRHQLAALLRHHRTGGAADRGSRRVRGRPRPAAAALSRGPDRRPARRPCRWPGRSGRLLPPSAPSAGGGRSQRTPWLVVEKILGADEALAADWGVDGTTGYEVMNEISALQHDPAGAEPLAGCGEISGRAADFESEERTARREILTRTFAGQLDAAATAFHRLARSELATRDLPMPALRRALTALITPFRSIAPTPPTRGAAVAGPERAKAAEPAAGPALDQIGRWLAGDGDGDLRAEAIRRFEQLSAPVAAKAVEDTAFYRYGRLLSRNDVGFDPARFSTTPSRLRRALRRARPRLSRQPAGHRHPRPQARRGCARALGGAERNARHLGRASQGLAGPRAAGRRRSRATPTCSTR
jgi:(1->4)-alpha-D-glucan 1-alpha-D-glucosylmutase